MFPACCRQPRSGSPVKMSYTRVVLGVLVVYVAHTFWALYGFIYTKPCDGAKADRCVTSYLSAKPRLQLSVYCALDVIDEAGYTLLFKVDIVDVNNDFERNVSVALHEMMLKEGSAYAIVFVHKNGVLPWKDSKHVRLVARLTSQTTEATTPAGQTIPVAKEIHTVSYWRSRLSLKVMNEDFLFNIAAVPSDLWRYMKIVEDEKQEKKKVYLPLLLVDEIRSRLIDFVEINSSTRAVPLTVAYNTISLGKFRIWIHIQAVLYSLRHFGFSEQNLDEIKALFVESGLHVLAVFMLVPAFHLSFEIFAFKNDIKFWKGNKSLAGISRRSVLWRCLSTFVIFLHLLEEGSGWMILLPTGVSALIELWKINKIMGLSSKAQVEKVGESVRETEVYDSAAMKFLSYLMYPLCISGAMYSYFYLQNKSWYSWITSGLISGVYAFGFLSMVPQLFINYKMKSVAHLQMSVLMYKGLSTFVSDVSGGLITSAGPHQLACFRDDVVFLVYLYQRRIYPLIKSRSRDCGAPQRTKCKGKLHEA